MFYFNKEYYFDKQMFIDEYHIGDKVYYLNENNEYDVGRIKKIEKNETNGEILYLVTGCLYLRSKEHIYGLYI